MTLTRPSMVLVGLLLSVVLFPVSAGLLDKAKETVTDIVGEGGKRHASTWFHYTNPSTQAVTWFDRVTPTHSSQSTFFATNWQKFGYMGLQQVEENGLFYQGYALFSIWDAGCGTVMDPSACPADQQAEIIECGEYATCSRFGGEGTGYKAVAHFSEWQVENPYGFLVQAKFVSSTQVIYEGYFHANELGGWQLLGKIKVNTGGNSWYIDPMGSFVEQWDDEEFQDKRWAYFGPSFVEVAGAQDTWKQVKTAKFSWTTGPTEVSDQVHGALSPDGQQWGMGFGGDLQKTASQNTMLTLNSDSSIPAELTEFGTLRSNGQLPTGCAGGTCTKAQIMNVLALATCKDYIALTLICAALVALLIGYAVCMLMNQRRANSPYGQAPPGQAPYGQAPYGQAPNGQAPYGQAPYGQAPFLR